METQKLTEKEREILVLCIVKECLEFAESNGKTFEEVLNEDVFPNEASTDFSELVCKTILSLNEKGYITGNVELEYEAEYSMDENSEEFEEEKTDAIDFAMCIFENIQISLKGKALMGIEGFKEVSSNFMEKAKPIIKCIATTTLQTCVESAVIIGLRAVGVPI